MKKLHIAILIITIFLNKNILSQNTNCLNKYNCQTLSVSYTHGGQKQNGNLLFVNYRSEEYAATQLTSVFLLNSDGNNKVLISDTSALYGMYGALATTDSKYIAFYFVSEGHPWIDIYNLPNFIHDGVLEMVAHINGYPGNINPIAWKEHKLIIESDIDLNPINEGLSLTEKNMLKKNKRYIFDPETKIFVEQK